MAFAPPAPDEVETSDFTPPGPEDVENVFPSDALITPPARPRMVSTTEGGPQRSGPNMRPLTKSDFTELVPDEVKEGLTRPIIPIPKFTVDPQGSRAAAFGKTAANMAVSIPEFLESPLGVVTAIGTGGGGLLARLVAAGFSAQAAKSVYDQQKELREKWPSLTPAQQTEALTQIGGTAGLAALAGHGAVKGLPAAKAEIPPEIAAAAKVLPRAAAEVAKIEPQPKEPNASSEQKATEVHGDVRPLEEPPGPLPAAGSGGGVQPQAAGGIQEEGQPPGPRPETLRPAIKVNGKVYPAEAGEANHLAVITRLKTGPLPDLTGNVEEGFVGPDGQFQTRKEGAATTGLPTATEPGKLHSSDLPEKPLNPGGPPSALSAELQAIHNKVAGPAGFAAKQVGWTFDGVDPQGGTKETDTAPQPALRFTDRRPGSPTEGITTYVPVEAKFPDIVKALNEKDGTKPAESGTVEAPGETKPAPAETQTSAVGLGGAAYGEIEQAKKYGVSARVRQERAQAGAVDPVDPGKGISAPDSVQRGRELLQQGTDPETVLSNFEATKKFSADDIAVVRAKGEELAKQARDLEHTEGTFSPEYQEAYKKLSDWDRRTKAMQTEWHRGGQAQQGETDLDTGTFTGLQRAYEQATGKEFTGAEAKRAQEHTEKVKTASESEKAAQDKLFDYLSKKEHPDSAEKRALDAAHKAVRDWAVRRAEADAKSLEIEAARKNAADKLANAATKKALESASKTVRDAAARRAEADAKSLEIEAARKNAADKLANAATKKALESASKTVRDAAARRAEAEMKAMERAAQKAKEQAEEARKAEKKAKEAVAKWHRDNATRLARDESKRLNDPQWDVWNRVRDYIKKGEDDFKEVVAKVATDTGMKYERVVRLLAQDQNAKRLANDVWAKQLTARRMKEQARRFVMQTAIPPLQRALAKIPRAMFGLKVGFHGTVALGTHAPMVAFQPPFWALYIRDFGKMYRMVNPIGNKGQAYYEIQVQSLLHRPNFITARRAGLVNDPFTYEDYNSPDMAKYIGNISGMGNRGYFVLKILRQDMFDQHWNALPDTAKTPEVASAIANDLNHATGVTKAMAPKGANLVLFAPRLEGSRIAWLGLDPGKAGATFANWRNATEAQKWQAINQVKEKAWVAGTMFGLLALNQGILSATGSKQKVNLSDPMKPDFLKFKVAGQDVAYGGAMISLARLPIRLNALRQKGGSGKMAKLVYPDESMTSEVERYVRSQLAPVAQPLADIAFKGDYANRPLPKMPLSGPALPMPKRLAARGVKPYSWTELGLDTVLPIPAEEPFKEVWQRGFGMSETDLKRYGDAFAKSLIMGATGSRLNEDTQAGK